MHPINNQPTLLNLRSHNFGTKNVYLKCFKRKFILLFERTFFWQKRRQKIECKLLGIGRDLKMEIDRAKKKSSGATLYCQTPVYQPKSVDFACLRESIRLSLET